ncbi:MAG: L-seryl-tRNA(Sec) selenium transferase, partial [Deltaproteobacteria bacterium]|nr:L-seryl-tRNA(Sec) selenium transferase [Deltaproteobacteria bacterium]
AQLEEEAANLANTIRQSVGHQAEITIERGVGRVGGGALPMEDLPGPRVSIRPNTTSAARLEQRLRTGTPPVIALVKDDAVLLDPRTLLFDQASQIPHLVERALKSG